MSQSFLRQVLAAWFEWQAERRLARLCPDIAAARAEVRTAGRRHKAVRPAMKALRDAVHAELRREVQG